VNRLALKHSARYPSPLKMLLAWLALVRFHSATPLATSVVLRSYPVTPIRSYRIIAASAVAPHTSF